MLPNITIYAKRESREMRGKLHSLTKNHNSMKVTKKRVTWEDSETGDCRDPATTALLASLIQVLVGLYFPISNSVSLISKDSLLQIWIPGEHGRTLSAMGSPHGIAYAEDSSSSKLLQRYKEESGLAKNNQFSSQSNYLHYKVAMRCGIRGSKWLPVFPLSSGTHGRCIAVLELVTTALDPDFGIEEYKEIKIQLQKVGLTTSNNVEHHFLAGSSLAVQGLQEPCSPNRSEKKGKQVENSDGQLHETTQHHNGPNKDIAGTSCTQGLQGEPNLLERLASKGKEILNPYGQFHEDTLNHNGPNKDIGETSKVCRDTTTGSLSSQKTRIVSAILRNPRRTRIFCFESALKIEVLKKSVANKLRCNGNAESNFDLHYAESNFDLYLVNKKKERVLIASDEDVKELFDPSKPPDTVVFVMDVETHESTDGDVSSKGKKRRGDQGVKLDINEDGFKMAYKAVRDNFSTTETGRIMQIVIGASLSKVKLLVGAAGMIKKPRTGEYSSSSNEDKHAISYGDQVMQHPALGIPSNRGLISHVEQTCDTSVETGDGAEQELPHNVEPFSAPQEENLSNGTDIVVAVGDDDQVIFYDENGNRFDESQDHGSGGILSAEFAPTVLQGEEIGRDEASRYKEMRQGECSSTVDISGNSNVDKHASSLYGDEQGMQPLESALPMEENPSECHLGVETNQVRSTELDPTLSPLQDYSNWNWDEFSQLSPLVDISHGEEEPMLPSEENTDRTSQRMKDTNRQWPSRLGIGCDEGFGDIDD